MRFKIKPKPKDEDIKIEYKFILFPMTLNNELRWLESAWIKYRYNAYDAWWEPISWHDRSGK